LWRAQFPSTTRHVLLAAAGARRPQPQRAVAASWRMIP